MAKKKPQEKKNKSGSAKRAAKSSIALRNRARSAKSPVIRKLSDAAANAALKRAMRINRETREAKKKKAKKK